MSAWHEVGGGYAYALCRVGMTLRAPNGATVYVQPGDDTTAMLENVEALEEVTEDKRGVIADMTLSEYFQ